MAFPGFGRGREESSLFSGIVDRVYVVSLASATDRRARLPGHLGAFGITDFTYLDAFGPDAPEVRALFEGGHVHPYPPCFRCQRISCGKTECNNVLIPAQVANVASFRAIWERVAAEPQVALILEDDVEFHPWAWKGVRQLRRHLKRDPLTPEKSRLYRLGWPHNKDHRAGWRTTLRDEVRMSNPCHIITTAYARALLERFDGVNTTSDIFIHRDAPRDGEALTIFPPIATELSFALGKMDSSIHPKTAFLAHLDAEGREDERRAHEAKIRRHVKHVFHRPLLVTGAPGGAIPDAAGAGAAWGLDLAADADGRHGLATWRFAVEDEPDHAPDGTPPALLTRRAMRWHHLVLAVEEPGRAIAAIEAADRADPAGRDFRTAWVRRLADDDLDAYDTPRDRSAATLAHWTRIVADQGPDFVWRGDHGAFHAFLARAGYPVGAALPPPAPGAAPAADCSGLGDRARGLLETHCRAYDYAFPAGEKGAG